MNKVLLFVIFPLVCLVGYLYIDVDMEKLDSDVRAGVAIFVDENVGNNNSEVVVESNTEIRKKFWHSQEITATSIDAIRKAVGLPDAYKLIVCVGCDTTGEYAFAHSTCISYPNNSCPIQKDGVGYLFLRDSRPTGIDLFGISPNKLESYLYRDLSLLKDYSIWTHLSAFPMGDQYKAINMQYLVYFLKERNGYLSYSEYEQLWQEYPEIHNKMQWRVNGEFLVPLGMRRPFTMEEFVYYKEVYEATGHQFINR